MRWWGFPLAALPGLFEAWQLRFVLDDAFISFRYAEHLAHGWGLVWNEHDRVEGYTNFLWTVILAVPHVFGWNVETFSMTLGLALAGCTLAIFYSLVGTWTGSWAAAVLATLTLGLFPSFAAFATSGLETQLQTCLVTTVIALVLRSIHRHELTSGAAATLGAVTSLAILTRMDSIVIVGPLLVMCGWDAATQPGSSGWRRLLPAFAIPLVVCGGWLAWKAMFYGSIVPNTFVAKVDGTGELARRGLRFVLTFVQAYAFYLPLASMAIGAWLAFERRLSRLPFLTLVGTVALWLVYVTWVGGDFMEYRMLVPILPAWLLLTYWVVGACDRSPVRAAVLASLLIGGGAATYASAKVPKPLGSPIPLSLLVVGPDQEWREVGSVLRDAFVSHGVRPSIAVVPAGVIPYESELPAVDMLGLNDAEVNSFTSLPYELVGHRRLAPLEFLVRRHVNLLIAYPVVRPRPSAPVTFAEFAKRPYAFADEVALRGRRLIEAPLSRGRVLLMVYLTENPALSARVQELGWRSYPLE